jgi:hypothetical protein
MLDTFGRRQKAKSFVATPPAPAVVPIFEARVDGPYAYLNTGLFLSSNPGIANGGVKITMYDSNN